MPNLEQIQAKLKKLQAQADALIAKKAQVAVDQIRDLMLKHGLTTADIEANAKLSRASRGLDGHARNGNAKAQGTAKVAKYRDHKTGATWTGHGRAPGWIANVKDRTPFLIEGAGDTKAAAKGGIGYGKGQPKGAQPPKYQNPKTGATWSGRGPAPAWLATVKDRTKFLIDASSAAGEKTSPAAKKAGRPKSVATSGAVSKKAAARKAVTGKSVAAKKQAAKKVSAKKVGAKKVSAKKSTPAGGKLAAKKGAATQAAGAKSTAVRAARKAPARKSAPNAVAASAPAAPQSTAAEAGA